MKIGKITGKKLRGIWTVKVQSGKKIAKGTAKTLPRAVRAATMKLGRKKS